jgi:ribosomal protein L3
MKSLNKPISGHFDKNKSDQKNVLREFLPVPGFNYIPGQVFNVSMFKVGDYVSVSGKSKDTSLANLSNISLFAF